MASGKARAADEWNPPAHLAQPLNEVWNHVEPTYGNLYGFRSTCPGGAARHCDQSLWLTKGFRGGAGGDWGQRMGQEYFTGALNQENIHSSLHEVGRTFGLDDFHDWSPVGQCCFPMKAGAPRITGFDTWMRRDFRRRLKSRYGL